MSVFSGGWRSYEYCSLLRSGADGGGLVAITADGKLSNVTSTAHTRGLVKLEVMHAHADVLHR